MNVAFLTTDTTLYASRIYLKILILLNEPYPFGMACTNRMHLYAKGLIAMGNITRILVPRPTERADNIINTKSYGIYEEVPFQYAHRTPVRDKSFLIRVAQDAVSFLNSFLIIIKFRPEIIILTGSFLRFIALAKICSLISGAKLVRERSEVPIYRKQKISTLQIFKLKAEYRLFDGMLVISKSLQKYFYQKLYLSVKIHIIPIIVDKNNIIESFNSDKGNPLNFVYTGSLIEKKDGILTIIKAFAIIRKKFPTIGLTLAGDIKNSPDRNKIIDLINELSLTDSISLPGYLPKDELDHIKHRSLALLHAKPKSRQNNYNMSTKIAEYLITGRPVVVSEIESACFYLTHRVSALIARPNAKSIARQLEFILENPNQANLIGKQGQIIALRIFDYRRQMQKTQLYFNSL